MKIIAILVLIGTISSIITWVSLVNSQTKSFKRYVKTGDPCYFYIGKEKYRGKIVHYNSECTSIVEDGTKKLHYIDSSIIYPLMTYNYKLKK